MTFDILEVIPFLKRGSASCPTFFALEKEQNENSTLQ